MRTEDTSDINPNKNATPKREIPEPDQNTLACDLCCSKSHLTSECPSRETSQCYLCGYDHNPKWCLDQFCLRCRSAGHSEDECTGSFVVDSLCLVCLKDNHIFDECSKDNIPKRYFKEIRCFSCGNYGHVFCPSRRNINAADNAPPPPQADAGPPAAPGAKPLLCSNCAQPQHYFYDCIEPPLDEKVAELATDVSKHDCCATCGLRGHTEQLCAQNARPRLPNAAFFDPEAFNRFFERLVQSESRGKLALPRAPPPPEDFVEVPRTPQVVLGDSSARRLLPPPAPPQVLRRVEATRAHWSGAPPRMVRPGGAGAAGSVQEQWQWRVSATGGVWPAETRILSVPYAAGYRPVFDPEGKRER